MEIVKSFKALRNYEKANIVLSGLTLVAIIVYTGVTWCLFYQTKKATTKTGEAAEAAKNSADTAKEALTITHRPWLGVDGSPQLLEPVTANKGSPNDTIHTHYRLSVKNFGTAIALHVGVDAQVLLHSTTNKGVEGMEAEMTEASNSSCRLADMEIKPILSGEEGSGQYIFPDNRAGYGFDGTSSAPNVEMKTGLRIVGCIAYKDEFKPPRLHHTRFCFRTNEAMMSVSGNTSFIPCPINQYAD